MEKQLIIAEKPSVARDIAKVLGATKTASGYLFNDDYLVSWAIGHLVTLCDPEDYDIRFKKWRKEDLPIIPAEMKLKSVTKVKAQLAILKKLMNAKEVSSIICATDSGREGELIFRYIYNITNCQKSFKRLWISSMTEQAIQEGFANLKDGKFYDSLYESARTRAEADWLVGINASRAFSLKHNALLSIGRVQTPTLAIIVERHNEITVFVPQNFWEVTADFGHYAGTWFDPPTNETKILTREKAEEIAANVTGEHKNGHVARIENEEKKTPPPLLYDLTELQRDCNKKFGFSAQKTLNLAQDLYEKRKMITYPRTDSRYLSEDYIPKIKPTINRLLQEPYAAYGAYVLSLDKLPITKRIVDNVKVSDHHAIVPADANINLAGLSDDERLVFDLIARRFFAVFYPYYIYQLTKIITTVNGESFVTKGTTVIQPGWMALYKALEQPDKGKEDETVLPNVSPNDPVTVKKAKVLEKKTQPPKPHTESSLLSAMEHAGQFVEDEALKEQLKENGLGTPATRAAIIERLLKVGYIERRGKNLHPTEKGCSLIQIVPPEIKSPETTGKWERGLHAIAKGKMDSVKFMSSIHRYISFIIDAAEVSEGVVFAKEPAKGGKRGRKKSPELRSLGKCPACGKGDILENSKSFYCSQWKDNCKFSLWKNSLEKYNAVVRAEDVAKLLTEGKIEQFRVVLPQTHEKAVATLRFFENKSGAVELVNLTRTNG